VSTPHIPSWCPGRLLAASQDRGDPARMLVMRQSPTPATPIRGSSGHLARRPDGIHVSASCSPRVEGRDRIRSAVFTSRGSDPTAIVCRSKASGRSARPFAPAHFLHRRSGSLRAAARFRPGVVRPTDGPAVRSPGTGGVLDGFWPRPVPWKLRGMSVLKRFACSFPAGAHPLVVLPPAGTAPGR
jgi:hypothetical protein